MQSVSWYCNRLRSMSPGEILWRTKSEIRDRLDRRLVGGRQWGRALVVVVGGNGEMRVPGFRVVDMALGQWVGAGQWCGRVGLVG